MFSKTRRFAGLAVLLATTAVLAKPVQTGRQSINGVDYYYEIHGKGEPLLLLHGGLGSIEMFAPCCRSSPTTAGDRGRSPGPRPHRARRRDRSASIDMGDDMAALVKQLGYEQVDVDRLLARRRRRVPAGGPASRERCAAWRWSPRGFSTDGFYPEMLPHAGAGQRRLPPMMKDTPMYKSYVAVAPNAGRVPEAARHASAT